MTSDWLLMIGDWLMVKGNNEDALMRKMCDDSLCF
jgi:hypothetical protein